MYNLLSESKILVIDDFAGFRQTLKTMLQRLGVLNIDQASNGSEAIKKCTEENYNIIFCDYNLGDGQDGQQILEELHHRFLLRRGMLFLMVTAETTTAQVMGAIEYRPDAYLTKPFTGEQLGQRLKRLKQKNEALNNIYQAINAGQTDKAMKLCDDTIIESPKLKYSCLRIKSEILEQKNNYSAAKQLFEDVNQEQQVLWAMVGLGRMLYFQDEISAALDHFQSMRETFHGQVSLLDWIAKCQQKLGEIEKAEFTLQQAIKISPKSVTRQVTMGEVAASLNHHDIAQKAFAKTIQEGTYSCKLEPQHFELYYDNTRELVKNLDGREKSKLLAETEMVHKKMERTYQDNPTALAANLSSAAMLFSSVGETSKTSGILSKLSKTLDNPGCKISDKQAKTIEKNLQSFAEDKSNENFVGQISSRLTDINKEIKARQKIEDAKIETDNQSKKINGQGMLFAKQGKSLEALNKFREAIKISPENMNYLLNASQIIIERKDLNTDPNKIREAKKYLQESIIIEETDIRWNRYQILLRKVSNV